MLAERLQRFVLRTSETPLRGVWVTLYRLITRVAAAWLVRGVPGASVYVRQGASGSELLPGMSDIDLALISPGGSARVRRRWSALQARLPTIDRLLDRPLIFDEDELASVASATCALTFGLDDGAAAYFGDRPNVDWTRTLEHPGLAGPTAGWRLLRGRDRRPTAPVRDAQDERLVAWLQVLLWWRWAFLFCDQPNTPRSADLCVKLIAEPARAWLWLAHRERAESRADALARLARRLPEEEPVVRLVLDVQRRLTRPPAAPFDQVLPALVRMTHRVDELIADEIAGAPVDEVRVLARLEPEGMELADWPGVVAPHRFAETFAVDPGDPADPAALVRAVHGHRDGAYRALRDDRLLVLPARPIPHSRLRAVKTRTTDPVSFALLAGSDVARFPRVRGWSAADLAARATAEHRAWLRTGRVPPRPWLPPPPASQPLAILLTAARAALLAGSLRDGAPELVADPDELGRRLGPVGEEAVRAHALSVASGEAPPPGLVTAVRERVAALYA